MTDATPMEMLNGTREFLSSCDATAWKRLIVYLLDRITVWIGHDIAAEPLENAAVGAGFCLDILGGPSSPSVLTHWKGILGATIIDDKLRVNLLVFPYCGSERLVTDNGCDFAEYFYQTNASGSGQWELLGWFKDEYEEFENRFA